METSDREKRDRIYANAFAQEWLGSPGAPQVPYDELVRTAASSALGGFDAPLNDLADIALVFEEVKPFRCMNVDRPSNRNPPRRRTVRILACTDPHTLLIVGKRQQCSDEVPKKAATSTEGLEADWSQTLRAIRGALTRNLETCRASKACGPLAHIERSADRGAHRRFLKGSRTALSC